MGITVGSRELPGEKRFVVTRDNEKMLISIIIIVIIIIRKRKGTTMTSSRGCVNNSSLNTTILTKYKKPVAKHYFGICSI